jgi:hypothetical protein
MNKLTGAILLLAASVSGTGVLVFVSSHPAIHKYDIPTSVSNMVLVAIAATTLLGLFGVYHLFKQDPR